MTRTSEPYSPTGGLAAEGVINQLGRPDIEPLEVLVREAVQNCWDAKRSDVGGIRVEIGRRTLDRSALEFFRSELFVDPPPGLPLADHLVHGLQVLHFADFGTEGLGGPTRADQVDARRDFVDFVRNIGQPPHKDLSAGSFGYGKAAFYIASRARTILVDTLCLNAAGRLERRLIGCALGDNFEQGGLPYTGRHWWGRLVDGIPEPLTGDDAGRAADRLGLPERSGVAGLGTTVAIIAPGVAPDSEGGSDQTMAFVADALSWNFWPRMIDTPGSIRRTIRFELLDEGVKVRIPDPRTHPRLRDFVEAMDRLREEPGDDGDLILDRPIESLRPVQHLGRLVIQKGLVAPNDPPGRAVPQGARMTADSVHHVALMRRAELIVKYLPGPPAIIGRLGYSGVFQCAVDVDEAFRRSEPPTHDDWVFRALPKGHQRSFVKIALERIARVCREAAGYDSSVHGATEGTGIALGEFADALASLMPGSDGPGARRPRSEKVTRRRRRSAPGRNAIGETATDVWVEGPTDGVATSHAPPDGATPTEPHAARPESGTRRVRPPQTRAGGDPAPLIASDGTPVIRYPFELRGHGSRIRLSAMVEVMSSDGQQVESDAPVGSTVPRIHAWIDPSGNEHPSTQLEIGPDGVDGRWAVEVRLSEELMMRVNVVPEIA